MNNIVISTTTQNNIQPQRDWHSVIETFLAKIQVSPQTKINYTKTLEMFFNFMDLQQVSFPVDSTIIDFIKTLEARHLKPTTIKTHIASIKRFFSYCSNKGIYSNIASEIKAPKIAKSFKKDCLTVEQVKKITSNGGKDRDLLIFKICVSCGLRAMEIANLNKEDVCMNGTTPVLWILGKGRIEKEFVPVPVELYQEIRNFISTQNNSEEALFVSDCNRSHKRISKDMISRIVKRLMRENGINDSKHTCHSCRHTFATISLEQGEQIRDVQQAMRHLELQTTLIYSHDLEKKQNTCSKTVYELLFK